MRHDGEGQRLGQTNLTRSVLGTGRRLLSFEIFPGAPDQAAVNLVAAVSAVMTPENQDGNFRIV
jgi:hypothetical protein